ncbi:MAG: hypothetical protein GF309_00660 [Candidatus Lokiarchaeota archaeon]|nr:hypothetical protein [Candidatus Lokiarchaeota archaeon]
MKVASAYVIRSNGELAYARVLKEEGNSFDLSLPSRVTAGVTLLTSSHSVEKQRTYFLEENDKLWAYAIFSEFAVVALTHNPDDKAQLKQRLVSLGKTIRKSYQDVLDKFSGEIPQMDEIDRVIDRYLLVNSKTSSERLIGCTRDFVDEALENYEVAYIGVFDAKGKMVYGNVPKSHALRIQDKIINTGFKPNPDMVPTSLNVNKYNVQFFKVGSFSVVAAPYKGGSKMQAVHAVDEITQALKDVSAS